MKIHLILFPILLILVTACGESKPAKGTVSPEITTVEWNIGNVPAALWPNGSGPSTVINFYVYFKSAAIEANDLKSVAITNTLTPNTSWNYTSSELSGRILTKNDGKKYLSLKNVYSDNITENGSVIFLGTYALTLELQNGETDSHEVSISAPNSLTADNYTHAYSPEDFTDKPPATYVALPKRAVLESLSLSTNQQGLIVKFQVNDSKVYSGWVSFYNQDGKHLGQTKASFRDFSTGTIHPKLNGGKAFRTDGTPNTLRISLADIEKAVDSDFKMTDIASIHLALSDGKQYKGTVSEYATYSYSVGTFGQE